MRANTLAAVCLLFLTASLYSQEMGMEEAMKLAQPGPEHEMLKSVEGSFDISFNYWMTPGTDPLKGTGTVDNKMILGGRFLESKSSTQIMGENKQGVNILGYDNRIKKHTIYIIDEFGTYGVNAEGDYDESSKTITYLGTDSLSASGMQMNFKFFLNMSNPDGYTFEVHFQGPDGNYIRAVEIIHTRRN